MKAWVLLMVFALGGGDPRAGGDTAALTEYFRDEAGCRAHAEALAEAFPPTGYPYAFGWVCRELEIGEPA